MNPKNTKKYLPNLLSAFLLCAFFLIPAQTNAAATINKVMSAPANMLGLVGWWTLDGKDTPWTSSTAATTLDKSGNGNTGTLTNMAQATSPASGKIGQGFNFDGSDDYVDAGNPASLQMGSNNFSVSLWVYGTSAADTPVQHGGFAAGGKRWQFQQSAVSNTKFVFAIDDDTTAKTVAGDKLAGNYWTHMVGVRDGNNLRLYEDGVQVSASPTDITGYGSITSTRNLLIGAGQAESDGVKSQFWDGVVDDVRIYNRALSQAEITALYASGSAAKINKALPVTAIAQANLVGHWTLDGGKTPWTSSTAATALDSSVNGNTGTLNNMAQATSPAGGKLGQGLRFDGTDDNIKVPDASSLDFGDTFTYSSWIKRGNVSKATNEVWMGKGTGSPVIGIVGTESTPTFTLNQIFYCNHSGTCPATSSNVLTNMTKFYHVVLTKNGAGTSKLYVDGVDVTVVGTDSTATNNSLKFGIGCDLNGSSDCYAGYTNGIIDDVRVYNIALSAAQVSTLYNLGAASHANVSTTNKLNSGLVGHWTFDGKDTPWTSSTAATTIDKSGSGNTGTLTNMSQSLAPVAGKIGQALKFDGTDDYVSIPYNVSINPSSTLSTCFWTKHNSAASGIQTPLEMFAAGGDELYFILYRGDLSPKQWLYGIRESDNTFVEENTGVAISEGVWQHICMTADGSTLRFYVNSSQIETNAYDGTLKQNASATLQIGADTGRSRYYDGSIDDVRIYNRALSQAEITQLYNLGR